MAVVMLNKTSNNNMTNGHLQNQLTRSLERILEDANASGELRLSGRKLKDFPKAAGKYNLRDTVIADLSRNRFCELPEEVTSFMFLETLLAYHNTIRSIPDTIRDLQSLAYLDLRNNQLTVLPREICFLPLLVLLVSNNRLVSLPEELGKLKSLTELDASCNQISQLPVRIGDLVNLKSLSLRSNQLLFLPREITNLQLVSLDISCNRIAALPVELRFMTSLVDLTMDNNPLTSPPASLCVRGLVHVFKYLEIVALKDEKTSKVFDNNTLRRQITSRNSNNMDKQILNKNIEANDQIIDKKWLTDEINSKFSPTPVHHTWSDISQRTNSTSNGNNTILLTDDDELKTEQGLSYNNKNTGMSNQTNSVDTEDDHDGHEKNRTVGMIQTYREYKEALRQQRNQDSSSIYRPKEQITPPECNSPASNPASPKIYAPHQKLSGTTTTIINQSLPHSPQFILSNKFDNGSSPIILSPNSENQNSSNNSSPLISLNRKNLNNPFDENILNNSKKPIQKVTPTPSRNLNGNITTNGKMSAEYDSYVKPNSPIKSCTLSTGNISSGVLKNGNLSRKTTTQKSGTEAKVNRTVSWGRDIPSEKMTFTMRREIDKQKEESELIEQLRMIIETKLKISLPEDIAPALMDGVVLCHLANYVRPRSVASIHVPSHTVPKLTMARCRKNVDNFIEACKKIGVDQELICFCNDIVPSDDVSDINNPPNPSKMFQTIWALLHINIEQQENVSNVLKTRHHHHNIKEDIATATNTNNTSTQGNLNENCENFINANQTNEKKYYYDDDDDDDEYKNCNYDEQNNNCNIRYRKQPPDSLDLNKSNRISKTKSKFQRNSINIINEDCEYDSDIGKFNCKTSLTSNSDLSSGKSSLSTPSLNNDSNNEINNLNTPKQLQQHQSAYNFNSFQFTTSTSASTASSNSASISSSSSLTTKQNLIDDNDDDNNLNYETNNKIVMKRIEFFENNDKIINKNLIDKTTMNERNQNYKHSKYTSMETIILLLILFLTVFILFLFPLPN